MKVNDNLIQIPTPPHFKPGDVVLIDYAGSGGGKYVALMIDPLPESDKSRIFILKVVRNVPTTYWHENTFVYVHKSDLALCPDATLYLTPPTSVSPQLPVWRPRCP